MHLGKHHEQLILENMHTNADLKKILAMYMNTFELVVQGMFKLK